MAKRIFINYRREDTQRDADALYDFLERKAGPERMFMDIDSIAPGADFTKTIQETLSDTAIVLMLIGPRWEELVQERASSGQPDYVLQEIDQALASGVKIIPVLFYRDHMPDFQLLKRLPHGQRLPQLETVNGLPINRNYRRAGYERLAAALDLQERSPVGKKPWRVATQLAIAVLVLAAVVLLIFRPWENKDSSAVQEAEAWKQARMDNTLAGFETYMAQYPEGIHQMQASRAVDSIHAHWKIPELVLLKGGRFQMGQPGPDIGASGASKDEQPVREVRVSDFYMGIHEVSQEAFQRIMEFNPSVSRKCKDCPVETVYWFHAIAYCNLLSLQAGYEPCYRFEGHGTNPGNWPENWMEYKVSRIRCNFLAKGFRLPTEAEWEYAARGGNSQEETFTYAGADTAGSVAWYFKTSSLAVHPAGLKEPNSAGLYDMSGNVWEWCWDWYAPYAPAESVLEDPVGPQAGKKRVMRGGSWRSKAHRCRITARDAFHPHQRFMTRGFRICRSG